MPSTYPKFRNRGESANWTKNQAAVLNRFNWPAKSKTRPEYVVKLASQIADLALAAYRDRVSK